MKKSIFNYSLIIGVLVLLLSVMLAGYSFASYGFADAVAEIDKTKSWAERSEIATRANELYIALSEEEKAEAAEDYATLSEELDELAALAASARRFIAYIDTLSDLSDLNEKESAVILAYSEGVYFSDESYPGISDAIAELESFDEKVTSTVNACIAFMDAVDLAILAEDDYVSLRSALDEAESYYAYVDNTYDGVRNAASLYTSMSSTIGAKEAYTKEFLLAAAELAEKTDYKTYLASYNYAKEYMADESFIPEFPGVEEARAELALAEIYIKECLTRANVFITAVGRFGSSDNIAADIIAAYRALEGVDLTVNGVGTAKSLFDTTLKEYNDIVDKIMNDLEIL